MSEIAVFGGTFDPPTIAHEMIIESCLSRDDFDQVWVMPSGKRVDKPGMTEDVVRLKMLTEVHLGSFGANERLVISDFEVGLPRPTRTIDTVLALEEAYPDDDFWFVFGADSYNDMHSWEGGSELRARLGMLVVARSGQVMPEEASNIRHLEVDDTTINVSSTKIRQAVCNKLPIERYASPAVVQFIFDNSLYSKIK